MTLWMPEHPRWSVSFALLSFGPVEVACALELLDEVHTTDASRMEEMRLVGLIPALYPRF